MSQILASTPRADGYFMPAEFDLHTGTWLLWPQRPDNWRLAAQPAQKAFVEVASAIAQFEPVTVGVNPDQFSNARQKLPANVHLVELSNNDAWMRDCGPTFIIDGKGGIRGIDWIFNAWGGLFNGLYYPWDQDDAVASRVFEIENINYYKAPIVLEGGSIHVDGQGTCLTTAECLFSPGRNPKLDQGQIEDHLKEYLNVEKVLWIPRGVYRDETTGHVDNIACFLRPGVIALTWTDDRTDPQYEISVEAFDYLRSQTDAKGRSLEIYKIHQPEPTLISQEEADGVDVVQGSLPRQAGDRLAASYINFYMCNGGAIIPTFGDPYDQLAIDTLQRLLPERRLVGIPSREILLGGGNIHCITQQQPKP